MKTPQLAGTNMKAASKGTVNNDTLEDGGSPSDDADGVQLMHAGTEPKKRLLNSYVLACALLASLSSALLGYDIGVMSGAVLFVEEDMKITTFQKELLVGSLNLVSLVGAAFAGQLADHVGRRGGMATAAALFLVGALSMSVAPTYGILLVGRLITGVGVGAALLIAPLYTAELAPAGIRGALVSLTEVFINVGILIGYIASYALSGLPAGRAWRWMVGLGALPAFFLGGGALFMPESPRWLAMRGRVDQALRVLLLTSSGDRADADARLAEIVESVQGKTKGTRLGRKMSGQQEERESSPLRPSGPRSRRGSVEERGLEVLHEVPVGDGRSGEARGENESDFQRKKGEEIARLQRLGDQPAFTQEAGSASGGRLARLHEPHEGTEGDPDVAGGSAAEGGAGGSGVWRDLVLHPTPVVKRMLLIGLGSNFFQQATGVDAIVYYAPAVFALAGITTRAGVLASTIVVGAAKAGFVLVAVFLLDRGWGRRPLLLLSAIGCTVSLVILTVGFLLLGGGIDGSHGTAPPIPVGETSGTGFFGTLAPVLAVTATCAYMAFFSAGLGPVNWVLVSEIFPSRLRAQAMGLATVVNRTVSGTVSMTFLSVAEAITAAGAFFLFAVVGLISVAFFYYLVPETKGKALEDIEKMLAQSNDSKATRSVVSTGANDGSTESGSFFSQVYHKLKALVTSGYSEVGHLGTDDDVQEDEMQHRKADGDTRTVNRLVAASEDMEARLSLRDKVKAIALRKSNVGPTESSRMLEDL